MHAAVGQPPPPLHAAAQWSLGGQRVRVMHSAGVFEGNLVAFDSAFNLLLQDAQFTPHVSGAQAQEVPRLFLLGAQVVSIAAAAAANAAATGAVDHVAPSVQ